MINSINKGFLVWLVLVAFFVVVMSFLSTKNVEYGAVTGKPRQIWKQVAYDLLAGLMSIIGFIVMTISCSAELAEGISFLIFGEQEVMPSHIIISILFTATINAVVYLILRYISIRVQDKTMKAERSKFLANSIAKVVKAEMKN